MNNVAAIIGIEQLKYVGNTIKKQRAHAARYNEAFRNLKAVKLLRYKSDCQSSYWLYTIRVKRRDLFMEKMKKADIVVSQVHARNDKHTIFKDSIIDLPGVDEFASEQVSIPVGWWLTEKNLSHIINAVIDYDQSLVSVKEPIGLNK